MTTDTYKPDNDVHWLVGFEHESDDDKFVRLTDKAAHDLYELGFTPYLPFSSALDSVTGSYKDGLFTYQNPLNCSTRVVIKRISIPKESSNV